jgi:uncharacterized membrane protein (UPF0182 family)
MLKGYYGNVVTMIIIVIMVFMNNMIIMINMVIVVITLIMVLLAIVSFMFIMVMFVVRFIIKPFKLKEEKKLICKFLKKTSKVENLNKFLKMLNIKLFKSGNSEEQMYGIAVFHEF